MNKDDSHFTNHSTQAAIALEYDGVSAPTVSALGLNDVAEKIIELAIQHQVPLYENAELARQLAEVNLGDEIPEQLFVAIAHIIAFAYHLQGKTPLGDCTQQACSGSGAIKNK